MTKAEIIAQLAKKTGIHQSDVQMIVEALFQLIQSSMLDGESIHFKGFGKFFNKRKGKKLARNLSDNTAMVIAEHYVPSLKPSKAFVNKIKETVKIQPV